MGEPYYDTRSAEMRLDRSICMYKGKPMYVEMDRNLGRLRDDGTVHPDYGFIFHAYKLDGRVSKPIKVDYRSDDFDYRAFPLGYINLDGTAYYLQRIPLRQQRQGLTAECISALPRRPDRGYLQSKEMEDCILGVYPGVEQALKEVEENGWESVAISRNVAIVFRSTGSHQLHYKGRHVGHFHDGKVHLVPSKEQSMLRQVIKDELGDALCLT